MKAITFTSNGDKIAGNLFSGKSNSFAFLLIQGWTGHQNIVAAQALADLGFTSMTYDMRGNGESEGDLEDFSRADFINDSVIAYDFLKQQVADQTMIGVVGSSFGSYTAVLLSERRPIACLSLRVPASYPDEGFDEPQLPQIGANDFNDWRIKKLDYSKNHAFKALHDFGGKVQIIEASADELVPRQAVMNYVSAVADKQQLKYEVMKDAPHRLENEQLSDEYLRLLTGWTKQFLDS